MSARSTHFLFFIGCWDFFWKGNLYLHFTLCISSIFFVTILVLNAAKQMLRNHFVCETIFKSCANWWVQNCVIVKPPDDYTHLVLLVPSRALPGYLSNFWWHLSVCLSRPPFLLCIANWCILEVYAALVVYHQSVDELEQDQMRWNFPESELSSIHHVGQK